MDDTTNWQPVQGRNPLAGVDLNAPARAAARDWRAELRYDDRTRMVSMIMGTLGRHLPLALPERMNELRSIAVGFEQRVFAAATSQSDYLRRITGRMRHLEMNRQHAFANAQVVPNQNNPGQGPRS